MEIQKALHKVVEGQDLDEDEMISVMRQIMDGEVSPASMASLLTALRMKGESVGEITGAARVMREKAETLHAPPGPVVDTCGTGGDGADTFNISTTAAFVVAGAGITVAKHGNRAVSSRSGSADVLKCLGVNIEADKSVVEKCLGEAGIGFLFAPLLHRAMKHAIAVRRELGVRTLFNLLGPLTNPAGAQTQVIGVFHEKWTSTLARVLGALGCRRAWVVHGADGLDEITMTDKTNVSSLTNGNIEEILIDPDRFGFSRCTPEELRGGTPEDNAAILREVLEGGRGPRRDIVLLNAGAAIHVAGRAEGLKEGIELAGESIDSGTAREKLQDLIRVSNS